MPRFATSSQLVAFRPEQLKGPHLSNAQDPLLAEALLLSGCDARLADRRLYRERRAQSVGP